MLDAQKQLILTQETTVLICEPMQACLGTCPKDTYSEILKQIDVSGQYGEDASVALEEAVSESENNKDAGDIAGDLRRRLQNVTSGNGTQMIALAQPTVGLTGTTSDAMTMACGVTGDPVACSVQKTTVTTYDVGGKTQKCDPDSVELPCLYGRCYPGGDVQSCSPGYQGPKCVRCKSKEQNADCQDPDNWDEIQLGFYRMNQACVPCPCSWFGFKHFVACAIFGFFLMLWITDQFDKAEDAASYLSTLTAPIVIMITFGQTLGLLIDPSVKIPWPPVMTFLMSQMNGLLNVNMEMAKPECTTSFGPWEKMLMTMIAPFALVVFIAIYSILRTTYNYTAEKAKFFAHHRSLHEKKQAEMRDKEAIDGSEGQEGQEAISAVQKLKSVAAAGSVVDLAASVVQEERDAKLRLEKVKLLFSKQFWAKERQVMTKAVSATTTVITMTTIFYVRACLRPFKCKEDELGLAYMVSSPDVQCIESNQDWVDMKNMGLIGIWFFAACYAVIAVSLVRCAWLSTSGRQDEIPNLLANMGFLGDKYEAEFFYWEAVIIARKLGIMIAFFLFNDEEAWLMGTAVVGVALIGHVGARPYEDQWTDYSEFTTLLAQMLLFVAAPVFKVMNDPEDPESTVKAARLMFILEATAIASIFGTCCIGLYAEWHVYHMVKGKRGCCQDAMSDEDYKERMIYDRILETRAKQIQLIERLDGLRGHHEAEERAAKMANMKDDALDDIDKDIHAEEMAKKVAQAIKKKMKSKTARAAILAARAKRLSVSTAISELSYTIADLSEKGTLEEFMALMNSLFKDTATLMDCLDKDRDGNISAEEFKAVVNLPIFRQIAGSDRDHIDLDSPSTSTKPTGKGDGSFATFINPLEPADRVVINPLTEDVNAGGENTPIHT